MPGFLLPAVNKSICVTDNKSACMFSAMPKQPNVARPATKTRARKAPPNPIGADGKTLQQRLDMAMAYKTGLLKKRYKETHLIRDANYAAGGTESDPKISQQSINAIRNGKVTRSSFTPFLAEACGVRTTWLANGMGPMTD